MTAVLTENLVDWNVGNMRDEVLLEDLLAMASAHGPAGFTLQEVGDRLRVLRRFCELSGYVLTRFERGDHSGAVATLTRGDLARQKSDAFKMTDKAFVGRRVAGSRDDGWTKPKWTVWQEFTLWDLDLVLAATHLTPSHQVRAVRRLVSLQTPKLAAWMLSRRGRVALLAGDFNARSGSVLLAPLRLIATVFTAPSHKGERDIDQWWIRRRDLRRLAKAGVTVTVTALEGYHSDHKPMMLTLTKTPLTHACPTCGLEHEAA